MRAVTVEIGLLFSDVCEQRGITREDASEAAYFRRAMYLYLLLVMLAGSIVTSAEWDITCFAFLEAQLSGVGEHASDTRCISQFHSTKANVCTTGEYFNSEPYVRSTLRGTLSELHRRSEPLLRPSSLQVGRGY